MHSNDEIYIIRLKRVKNAQCVSRNGLTPHLNDNTEAQEDYKGLRERRMSLKSEELLMALY